ncbi:anti-anti-sigma factor [Paraperlucidibaca baekdonensis]|uniref:Anti-anti-sigma factor n=1 Tax=Paraperlucidibaca baekdonensis TaxID=748120 RepID=A0A3E0H1K9_9GAMM|nr:STAS domain-containing protein [Paraperlucidibaca baekdonensis]REH36904.1 anti-anti-sigma factor [Paraperlucidibaca baekdonensis]
MDACKMQYAVLNGTYVLKLVGDVRVPTCTALETFVEQHIKHDEALRAVLIDLTATESIDSTALGLLARIAVVLKQRGLGRPVLLCINPDIERILLSMGFNTVFRMLHTTSALSSGLDELPSSGDISEDAVAQQVIDAHRTLMSLNESNSQAFRSLVDALESEKRCRD